MGYLPKFLWTSKWGKSTLKNFGCVNIAFLMVGPTDPWLKVGKTRHQTQHS